MNPKESDVRGRPEEENPYRLEGGKYATHALLAREIGTNSTVLDVGCNTGYLGSIAHASNTFFGLDFDARAVEQARQNYQDAVSYDLEHLVPLPWDQRFDTIVFGDVLEHVRNPVATLKFFLSYLADGGKVVVSLPNIANWSIRAQLLLGRFEYTDAGILDRTHLHFYTKRSAPQLLRDAGLEVARVQGGSSRFGGLIGRFPVLLGLLTFSFVLTSEPRRVSAIEPTSAGQ